MNTNRRTLILQLLGSAVLALVVLNIVRGNWAMVALGFVLVTGILLVATVRPPGW